MHLVVEGRTQVPTPLAAGAGKHMNGSVRLEVMRNCQKLVGHPLHISGTIRLDIGISTSHLARHMHVLYMEHCKNDKHVIRCRKGSEDLGIIF